jgi:hypothetical protein
MLTKEYDRLLQFAKFFFRNKPHIDFNDIVNDVVLSLLNSGNGVTYSEGERLIKKHPDLNARGVNQLGRDFGRNDTQRVCKDCHELMPVGAFYLLKQKDRLVVSSYCKSCHSKRVHNNKLKEDKKAKYSDWQRLYLKRTWAKEVEYLSDKYITKCLMDAAHRRIRAGLTTREEVKNSITKDVIKRYREKKLNERATKSSKQAA